MKNNVLIFTIILNLALCSIPYGVPVKEIFDHKLEYNDLNQNKNDVLHANDFNDYLKEISVMDCSSISKVKEKKMKIKHILCPGALKKLTIRPIGNFNYNPQNFYDYLINMIYGPLGYKIKKKKSFSELLNDLVFLDNKFSLIKGKYKMQNFESFNQDIGDIFSNMSEKTENLNLNKDEISDDLIKILKKFHIFWNTMRSNNNVDLLKTQTLDILKNILEKYLLRQKNLTHVTINLMDKIKESYYKFLRAHKMIEVLKVHASDMIVNQIIKRYNSIVKNIENNNLNSELKVQEMSFILDLVKSFFVVNYRNKMNDLDSRNKLNLLVVEKIKTIYIKKFNQLKVSKDNEIKIKNIKYFTATILLKVIHRSYIMFEVYNVSEYINMPKYYFENDSNVNIKVYYEFLDNMVLIPEQCLKIKFLKDCTEHEINRIINYLNIKYQISDSVNGHDLLSYLKTSILEKISKQNFKNVRSYKNEFYNNLSKILKDFRTKYYINDLSFLESLELEMGNKIEDFKNKNEKRYEKSINDLDKAMYDEFIDIKAIYNNLSVNKLDATIVTSIKTDLLNFIDNFEEENKKTMNHTTIKLIEILRKCIEDWVITDKNISLINQAKLLIQHQIPGTHEIYQSALSYKEIKRLEHKKKKLNFSQFGKYPSISKFSLIKNSLEHDKIN